MTATTTATVTVNPAFLLEISRDAAQASKALLDELHAVCACSSAIEPERFTELIDSLQDHLALRFALEDGCGYFEDPLYVEPAVAVAAEHLRAEHAELLNELFDLCDRAHGLLRVDVPYESSHSLALRLRSFLDRLRRHEASEQRLLWYVFQDLGVGD
jgi:hypothetical protein